MNRRMFLASFAAVLAWARSKPQPAFPMTDGAGQEGSHLYTDGWPANSQIMDVADIFTIAGVNHVNPITGQDTLSAVYFAAKERVTADWRGRATIKLAPPLIPSGHYRNISNSPADNALIHLGWCGHVVARSTHAPTASEGARRQPATDSRHPRKAPTKKE